MFSYSINDVIRQKLQVFVENNSIYNAIKFYQQLSINDRNIISRLLVSDYLKISAFKSNIENLDTNKLIENVSNECMLFTKFLIYPKLFNDLSLYEKVELNMLLTKINLDDKISQVYKYSFLDKITYNKKYDIESLKLYHNSYLDSKMYTSKYVEATNFSCNSLYELKGIDEKEYNKDLLMFIRDYYKIITYCKIKEIKKIYDIENFYYEYIKRNRIKSIIKLANIDDEFFQILVSHYFNNNYCISSEEQVIIDDTVSKNVDKKIKKKFKF